MDQKHRKRIDICCEKILRRVNMPKLWPFLLEYKIYNKDDINISRWKNNFDKEETIREIILTIKTRGPNAFKNLLTSLRQSGQEDLADLLEDKVVANNNHAEPEIHCNDDFFYHIQKAKHPLQIKVKKAQNFSADSGPVKTYRMRSKPRGMVLIITNINYQFSTAMPRESAVHDETNLKTLFEDMGFLVISKTDLKSHEILETVREFSQREELKKVDSCFVIISSHGNRNSEGFTEIQGVDYNPAYELIRDPHSRYKPILCLNILDFFTSNACHYLAEKPKVFIFQLCRGIKKQMITKTINEPRHKADANTCGTIPIETPLNIYKEKAVRNNADMLLVYATLPGHVAFRDNITGSWFIQILCEVFMNYAKDNHLCDLLKMVDSRLGTLKTESGECQTMTIELIGFNKHCYLYPGLFE